MLPIDDDDLPNEFTEDEILAALEALAERGIVLEIPITESGETIH